MNKLVIFFAILLVAASARTETFKCPEGYVKSPLGQLCEPCKVLNCKICSDYRTCTSCNSGYAMLNNMCQQCPTGVKECCALEKDSNSLKAISCNDGYSLLGSVCVLESENCLERDTITFMCKICQDKYYLTNTTGSTTVCTLGTIDGCTQYYNQQNCQTCDAGQYRTLVADDTGTFYKCENCPTNCLCQAKDTCDDCYDTTNTNLYFQSGSTCTSCALNTTNCSKCTDAKGCIECKSGYQLIIPDANDKTKNTCVVFPDGCEAVDLSNTKEPVICKTCIDGQYLDSNKVCQPCADTSSNIGVKLCESASKIIQCIDPPQATAYPRTDAYRLVTINDNSAPKQCVKITLNGESSNSCWEINDGTIDLVKNVKSCKSCYTNEGYFLVKNTKAGDGIANCLQQDNVQGCKEYQNNADETGFVCQICMDGMDLADSNYQTTPSTDGLTCTPCSSKAKTCNSDGTIQSCIAGSYLKGNACLQCISNCAACTDDLSCTTCIAGYMVESGKCVACTQNCDKCSKKDVCDTCSSKYFLDPSSQFCMPMRPNCAAFEPSGGVCKRCIYGYEVINGWCLRCTDQTFFSDKAFEGFYFNDRCKKITNTATCSSTIAPPNPPGPNPTPDGNNTTPTNGTSNNSTNGTSSTSGTGTDSQFSHLISFSFAAILSVFFMIL